MASIDVHIHMDSGETLAMALLAFGIKTVEIRPSAAQIAAAHGYDLAEARPGANIHGLGPDEPNGLNPDYEPGNLTVDVEGFVGEREDAEPGERQRRKRRTKAEMEAARPAPTVETLSPTPDSATAALNDVLESKGFGPSVPVEPLSDGMEDERPTTAQPDAAQPTAQDPPVEAATPASEPITAAEAGTPATGDDTSVEDDDADAEGLSDLSDAQDRLDREYAETMREDAPVAEQELALEPENPILAFIHTIPSAKSWADGKEALVDLMQTDEWAKALPHEQRGVRLALWNIPARHTDKVDPAADVTAFMCWCQGAPEEDQVDGTLEVLERADIWGRLTDAQRTKIRDTAAEAKRRIAGAAE